MKLNKNYAGISFLYRQNGAVSTVMEIVMKEPIVGPMLQAPEKMEDDTDYRYPFVLDNDSLVAYAKSIGASPATAIALLVSKAIYNVHPEADKPIVCSMANNIRTGLNADNTFKNCVNSIKLPYCSDKSEVEQIEEYRRIIKEHKDENYMKYQQ